jgi:hypothetical protein
MSNPKPIRAYDPKNKKWYTWSWIIPNNLLELIKLEGLILEKDMKTKPKK